MPMERTILKYPTLMKNIDRTNSPTVKEVEFVPRKFNSVEWAEMNHNLSVQEWAELNKNLQGVTK
jgi:hypothetical protein